MKIEHWFVLALAMVLCFFIPVKYQVSMQNKTQDENVVMERNVIQACKNVMEKKTETQGKLLFDTAQKRDNAAKIFYATLAKSYNHNVEETAEEIYARIPCMVLVDWDGYYISYQDWKTAADGSETYAKIISEKSTWTKTYGIYTVSYKLNNDVAVSVKSGTSIDNGDREEVFQKLGQPSRLSFLSDADTFNEERNSVLISTINRDMEYFINTHNEYFNKKGALYALSLPQTDSGHIQAMLEKPNVIAFMQGKQATSVEGTYVNVYAFVSADMEDGKTYRITKEEDGSYCYHESDCPDAEDYNYAGGMLQCAYYMASPDKCVR